MTNHSRVDMLGESLELPEELSALTGDFPSVPTCLPDELRGALLLPSDDSLSQSYSGGRSGDDSSYENLVRRFENKSNSSSGRKDSDALSAANAMDLEDLLSPDRNRSGVFQSVRESPEGNLMSASVSPAPSSERRPQSVGLSGANESPDAFSQSSKSKSDKSRDWSLSDTDLKELLEQGNPLDFVTPTAAHLSAVPEGAAIVHPHAVSSLSSPSQSCSHETSGSSQPHKVASRSVPDSSPAHSATSSNPAVAAKHSSPQSFSSGTTSQSVVTNWSSASRNTAAIRSSLSSIGGRAAHAAGHPVCSNDILESSITSSDSHLL